MILTDGVHLVSDESVTELHRYADRVMGFKRHWFRVGRGHPHYDLTTETAVAHALRFGATRVSKRQLVKWMARR